jgi:hypothetical protein
MYLVDPSLELADKRSWMVKIALLCSAFLFSVFWLTFCVFYQPENGVLERKWSLPRTSLEKVGLGGFALKPHVHAQEFMPVIDELVLIGKNSRPDSSAFPTVKLGLKSSGNQREVICGQAVDFSNPQMKFTVTPRSIVDQGVLVEVAMGENREEFVLSPSRLFQPSCEEEEYFQVVKNGQFWGSDIFLQHWGGMEYQALSSKQKIEMGGKVYFVAAGDFLWWNGDAWKMGKPSLIDAPLMKILVASPQILKAEIWDKDGFSSKIVQMPLQTPPKNFLKADEMMTAVRSRASDEITCQLGKRRVTVREGDWWVHNKGRWKVLKNGYDLEAFLNHEIPGELFIFEKIENGKEKVTLKARSFDRMRTHSEPISLVFNTEKKMSQNPAKELARASVMTRDKMAAKHVQKFHENEEKQ